MKKMQNRVHMSIILVLSWNVVKPEVKLSKYPGLEEQAYIDDGGISCACQGLLSETPTYSSVAERGNERTSFSDILIS